MIPRGDIVGWRSEAPWVSDAQVEINTREHFSVLGFARQPFSVHTRWFTGRCDAVTYALDELLGTKLRALYQRRKGRDLFDLWLGLTAGNASPKAIVQTFHRYMDAEGSAVTRRQFEKNMAAKIEHKAFLADTDALIRPTISYDPALAYELVCNKVIALLD